MNRVNFHTMLEATEDDWNLLLRYEAKFASKLPNRILNAMTNLDNSLEGYQVSRLTHCLQTATRAMRDGADEEMIVAALIHDIGDEIATFNHAEMAAAIIKPYVREEVYWVIKHHSTFQLYYYGHLVPRDNSIRNLRDQFKNNKWYNSAVKFCERYDSLAFDPTYDTLPLSAFEPLVHDIFRRDAWTSNSAPYLKESER